MSELAGVAHNDVATATCLSHRRKSLVMLQGLGLAEIKY